MIYDFEKMPTNIGKPPKIPRPEVENAVRKRLSEVFSVYPTKLMPKTDSIWTQLSVDLQETLKPKTIFNLMCQKSFRQRVLSKKKYIEGSDESPDKQRNENISEDNDSSTEPKQFIFRRKKEEFSKILEQKEYNRFCQDTKKHYSRKQTVMKPGIWQQWITQALRKEGNVNHGYRFKKSNLNVDATSGRILGRCKCGSSFNCQIFESSEDEISFDCCVTAGNKKIPCSKIYLRNPIREKIGKDLRHKSVEMYRIERAATEMKFGEDEPADLYDSNILAKAKSEQVASEHIDANPLRAVEKLKYFSMPNTIKFIGTDPPLILYWTHFQRQIYVNYAEKNPACLAVDATGGIFKPIILSDGSESGPLFLYQGVVTAEEGNFSVCQMISASHSASKVGFWLSEWGSTLKSFPKEFVSDAGKAIIIGAIKAFSGFLTIEDYVIACDGHTLPSVYIRIDVAHFMKIYSNLLKNIRSRIVRVFYKAAIGLLIKARNPEEAKKILKAILLSARCPTDGNLKSKKITECQKEREALMSLLDPNAEEEETDEEDSETFGDNGNSSVHDNVFDDESCEFTNKWFKCAQEIDEDVKRIAKTEKSLHVNAFEYPQLANKLVKDMRFFTLWSCINRDRFGYGRIPASSAGCESEFKNIKKLLLKSESLPMRVDSFLELHILKYINGRIHLVGAKQKALRIEDVYSSSGEENSYNNITNDSSMLSSEASMAENVSTSVPQIQTCSLCNVQCLPNDSMDKEYGHICSKCNEEKSARAILASRQEENWGGLVTKKRKKEQSHLKEKQLCTEDKLEAKEDAESTKENTEPVKTNKSTEKIFNKRCKSGKLSRYIDVNQHTFDALKYKALDQVPLLKNVTKDKLQSLTVGKKKYSFTFSCAFDSIVQMLVVAAFDNPDIHENFKSMINVPTIQLVTYILKNKINTQFYRLRGNILLDVAPKQTITPTIGSSYLVKCQTDAKDLAARLFQLIPSFTETSTCEKGCTIRTAKIPTFSVDKSALFNDKFDDVINNYGLLKIQKICPKNKNHGFMKKIVTDVGPLVFLELQDPSALNLDEIPKVFKNPISSETYFTLLGVVNFIPPKVTRFTEESMGHYTAFCRRNKDWYIYDDLGPSCSKADVKKDKVLPGLLIYYKTHV